MGRTGDRHMARAETKYKEIPEQSPRYRHQCRLKAGAGWRARTTALRNAVG
jgi:hypothetical protein